MRKSPHVIFLLLVFYANVFSNDFSAIDDVISRGISDHSFPGAQVLIGNERDILYEKSYGNFTYDDFSRVVTNDCMFDLASVTKVVATTSAIMKLYDEKKISLTDRVAYYIPEFGNNWKGDITVLNLLVHNSGLVAFVPFYKTYSSKEEVLNAIYNIGLDYPTGSKTIYSDLNAVLLGLIVEKITGMKLDEYCRLEIFEPLGMKSTMFAPDSEYKDRILPTEVDNYWRHRALQGEVHDETTAILGGVSGNAGLFSNAGDLYKFMRMMLNKGSFYNTEEAREETEFNPDVVSLFVKRYDDAGYQNSRALGWDTKPIQKSSTRIPCGELFSENCFGHTGYTGTSVWCDTDRKLIVILLTNRVYPSRNNSEIRNIRPEIHNLAVQIVSGG